MKSEILNGVEVLIEPTHKYIQINDATDDDLRGIWQKLQEKFPKHEAVFCFRNVPVPQSFMTEIDAKLIDDSLEMRLSPADFENFLRAVIANVSPDSPAKISVVGVTPITAENYDKFAAFHDQTVPDMYWNSTRILEKIDLWRIFACFENEKITDYALLMQPAAEIFGCQTSNIDHAKALLAAASQEAFVSGAEELLYMIDKDQEICKNAAVALGFRMCGYYRGYRIVLP